MAIDIPCPHCGTRNIETVRSAWYIRGFLVFAQWGSNAYVGCLPCTRKKVLGSLAITTLIGWWCFPWGLGTPIVLIQNGFSILSGADRPALASFLAMQGIAIDEVELDASGQAPGQARLIEAVLTVLHRMVWADGSADPREIDVGTQVAGRMLGDLVDAAHVHSVLSKPDSPGVIDVTSLPADTRAITMKAAAAVAAADDVIDDAEVEVLKELGNTLQVPKALVQSLIASLNGDVQVEAERNELRAVAADVLAISPDAPAAQIQAKYRAALLSASGIDEEDEAAEARERIQWAYQTLMG